MRAVQNRHIAVGRSGLVERFDLRGDPTGFLFAVGRVVAQNRRAARQHGQKVFFDAVRVFRNQTVAGGENFRRRAVIFHHHDGLRRGIDLVKVQQIPHVGPAPCVDRLVGVADDEQVLVILAQHLHQRVLRRVNVLKFVDHDVFQPLLPLEADILMRAEDVEREDDQVVIIQREALLFLIEIAVKNNIFGTFGLPVFFLQRIERQREHILVIRRPLL